MVSNQWDLGTYLNMALLKVEQGHYIYFFVFYYGYKCLEAYIKYLDDSNALYSDAAVQGFIF